MENFRLHTKYHTKHPKKTIFKPKTQKRDKKICVLKEKAVTLHTLLRETAP